MDFINESLLDYYSKVEAWLKDFILTQPEGGICVTDYTFITPSILGQDISDHIKDKAIQEFVLKLTVEGKEIVIARTLLYKKKDLEDLGCYS